MTKQPFFSIHNPRTHEHVAAEWQAFDEGRDFSVVPRHHQPLPGRPNGIDFDADDMATTTAKRGLTWIPAPGSIARFLVSQNGGLVTKVKVHAGETVTHRERRDNGEGVTTIIRSWEFDGETVYLSWVEDGSDCDGRLVRSGSAWCDLGRLADGYIDPEGQRWPRWEHTGGRQRDFAAEAAGY